MEDSAAKKAGGWTLRVAMNLCTNALQAMGLDRADVAQERRLSHDILAPGSYIRLCVHDTGSGIPPRVLERVFDPFFTTKGVGEGTDSTCRLCTASADLEGAIDVRTTVGRGTTFTIWLPIAGEATAPLT